MPDLNYEDVLDVWRRQYTDAVRTYLRSPQRCKVPDPVFYGVTIEEAETIWDREEMRWQYEQRTPGRWAFVAGLALLALAMIGGCYVGHN